MKNLQKVATFLELEDIANGCGQKGGPDLEKGIDLFLSSENYDPVKGQDWKVRVRSICCIHDLFYDLGGNWFIRLIADVWFCWQIWSISSWVPIKTRISGISLVYIGVRMKGKNTFLYSKQ